jgi:hypothetical protein
VNERRHQTRSPTYPYSAIDLYLIGVEVAICFSEQSFACPARILQQV